MRADRLHRGGARLLALGLALAGALAPVAGCRGDACVRHSDCDPGLVCSPLGACVTSLAPDGGDLGDAADGAVDAALDAADDAVSLDASAGDAALDAATDAAVDAAIDAVPPPPLPPYIDPGPPMMSQLPATTPSSTGSR